MKPTVTGDIRLNLSALNKIRQLGDDVILKTAEAVATQARHNVPVDTGALRDSIEVVNNKKSVSVVTQTGYGGFVELGTVKMAAQPFMRPALEQIERMIAGGWTPVSL